MDAHISQPLCDWDGDYVASNLVVMLEDNMLKFDAQPYLVLLEPLHTALGCRVRSWH